MLVIDETRRGLTNIPIYIEGKEDTVEEIRKIVSENSQEIMTSVLRILNKNSKNTFFWNLFHLQIEKRRCSND